MGRACACSLCSRLVFFNDFHHKGRPFRFRAGQKLPGVKNGRKKKKKKKSGGKKEQENGWFNFVFHMGCFRTQFNCAGADEAVHGCGSWRLHLALLLPPPGSTAPPPQEKTGTQVQKTGITLVQPY